jgi:hypothetical protein
MVQFKKVPRVLTNDTNLHLLIHAMTLCKNYQSKLFTRFIIESNGWKNDLRIRR